MSAFGEEPELTPEQRAVVEQPAEAPVLVTAGAGAGKTHTLVRRLGRLVIDEGLTAQEILVLTFTRSAVRELRARLARHGHAVGNVRAQTFDSWALDILTRVDAVGEWHTRSFDDRIEGARKAIEDGLADEVYEDLRHVIIDEVQDLVGARRELVEALVDRFECGFTIVGDPAQSIYGFTVKDHTERAGETNRFFDWLRNTFGEDLVELSLTRNFRARRPDAEVALPYGAALRSLAESAGENGAALYGDLRSTLISRLNLGKLDELIAGSLVNYPGRTAVLCRTNGQALIVSEQMHRLGVPHRLQRSAQDRVAPTWLGLLFRHCDGSVLGRSRFGELQESLPLPDDITPDGLWRLLLRADPRRNDDRSLDLGRLRTMLAVGRLPDELIGQPSARLTVSSFHRAKGLEFDKVVIVDPRPLPVPNRKKTFRDIDPAEEARGLYVAMTRPRDELYWLDELETRHVRIDDATGRWGRFFFQHWTRLGLEINGRDVHSDQPAGMRDFQADPVGLQTYLVSQVRPGDEIVLERLHPEAIELKKSPPYLIRHKDRVIGTASDGFRSDLYKHLKLQGNHEPWNWPASIRGIRVDAVETVTGSDAAGIQASLGSHGVWLAPRLVGLGDFVWDKKESKENNGVTA